MYILRNRSQQQSANVSRSSQFQKSSAEITTALFRLHCRYDLDHLVVIHCLTADPSGMSVDRAAIRGRVRVAESARVVVGRFGRVSHS